MISIKDANDQWVVLDEDTLMDAFRDKKLTIFGMDLNTIGALRDEFYKSTGCPPKSADQVRSQFPRKF